MNLESLFLRQLFSIILVILNRKTKHSKYLRFHRGMDWVHLLGWCRDCLLEKWLWRLWLFLREHQISLEGGVTLTEASNATDFNILSKTENVDSVVKQCFATNITFGDKIFYFRSPLVKTLRLDSLHLNILQAGSSRLIQTIHSSLCTEGVVSDEA